MVRILKILELEAIKDAERWAIDRKVMYGKYPTMEEFLKKKNEFLKAFLHKAYTELSKIMEDYEDD
ncbi:MAG: hypothetical protein DRO93_08630 [Candidatus Thorarchaeota archaeon]|nr:MAG: hypothetical protein DRO93_08630 [Candidatus Thorarchaeota archaeon]